MGTDAFGYDRVPCDTCYTWPRSCTSRMLRLCLRQLAVSRTSHFSLQPLRRLLVTSPSCSSDSLIRRAHFAWSPRRRNSGGRTDLSFIERRPGGFCASRGVGLYSHLAHPHFESIMPGRSSQTMQAHLTMTDPPRTTSGQVGGASSRLHSPASA